MQSCSYFNELTRTLPVWKNQYRQYVAETIRPPRLEEPLELYSAADLEQWVLRRRSANLGWKRPDTPYTRIREIESKDVGGVYIVPGGRWLLVGDQGGSLLAYDLDAPLITKNVIIPQDAENQQAEVIAIDVEPETQGQNLAFTVAVSPTLPSSELLHICPSCFLTTCPKF